MKVTPNLFAHFIYSSCSGVPGIVTGGGDIGISIILIGKEINPLTSLPILGACPIYPYYLSSSMAGIGRRFSSSRFSENRLLGE
jgi:hypothetical protein